mmetsp:Transcript_89588/g.253538  ORF Transcript_89588/g.253538 Transcript_89588/m.253538 type:complete len:339 (+) Transcript_89588:814-1830(+)
MSPVALNEPFFFSSTTFFSSASFSSSMASSSLQPFFASSQQYSFFLSDHPFFQLEKPASQSNSQPTCRVLQQWSFFACDQPSFQLAAPASQSKDSGSAAGAGAAGASLVLSSSSCFFSSSLHLSISSRRVATSALRVSISCCSSFLSTASEDSSWLSMLQSTWSCSFRSSSVTVFLFAVASTAWKNVALRPAMPDGAPPPALRFTSQWRTRRSAFILSSSWCSARSSARLRASALASARSAARCRATAAPASAVPCAAFLSAPATTPCVDPELIIALLTPTASVELFRLGRRVTFELEFTCRLRRLDWFLCLRWCLCLWWCLCDPKLLSVEFTSSSRC